MEHSNRLEDAERLLDEHGRRLGPARVALGRSGLALGFPRDPMLHISWPALAAICGLLAATKVLRALTTGRGR
jgi:hypothetical protein